jgi:hypothetical protein
VVVHQKTTNFLIAKKIFAPTGQAPDDATRKLTELVHAGKYAEAQQLTAGLLIAYPNDQRLIKAKAMIEKLLSPADRAHEPLGNSQPVQPVTNTNADQLSGMEKLDYNALIEMARQAQQTIDLSEQETLRRQFMEQSELFLQKHADQMLIWQLRAASAISLKEPMEGYEAGTKLLAAGAMDSSDPNLQRLLAKLKVLGWLDTQKAQELQLRRDKDKQQQAAAAEADLQKAEAAKYTLPVAHPHLFTYGYGHITIGDNEAVYSGSDGTIRLSKADIHEIKAMCLNGVCGLLFHPNRGSSVEFIPVTEYAVTNQTDKGAVFFPPSVLGDAVVARWKFVSDGKSIKPPVP